MRTAPAKHGFSMTTIIAFGFASLVLVNVATSASATLLYKLVDLGSDTVATGINAAGQVVGYSIIAGGETHAFLYDSTGMHDLGTSGITSAANAINNAGQIVGYAGDHAFLYDSTGMHTLAGMAVANDINNAGQVVGYSTSGGLQASLYDGTGTHILVGMKVANGINDTGQIVGYGDPAYTGYRHALLYDSTGLHFLGALVPFGESDAYDINNAGEVTGYSSSPLGGGTYQAFLYDSTGMHNIGGFNGEFATGLSINDAGEIVGYSENYPTTDAFFYDGSKLLDLNNLIDPNNPLYGSTLLLRRAAGINDAGEIVAMGSIDFQYGHSYLLIPHQLPEPQTAVLLSFGLAGLAFMRRKRAH